MEKNMGFVTTPGGGGGIYKPRVWIHYEHERTEIGTELAKLSMWRGVDKRHYDWVSYECRQEQLDKAIAYLTAQGFQRKHTLVD